MINRRWRHHETGGHTTKTQAGPEPMIQVGEHLQTPFTATQESDRAIFQYAVFFCRDRVNGRTQSTAARFSGPSVSTESQ